MKIFPEGVHRQRIRDYQGIKEESRVAYTGPNVPVSAGRENRQKKKNPLRNT